MLAAGAIWFGADSGITIVLADDDPRGTQGATEAARGGSFRIVAEAADIGETRRKVVGYKPTVLTLDLSLPNGSSLEAILVCSNDRRRPRSSS